MKIKFLITLVFFAAGVFFLATTAAAQKLTSGGKPKASAVEGFDEAFCVGLSGNFKVCRAADAERESPKYLILRNDKTLTSVDSTYFGTACCAAEDFFAFRGDLDKDGAQEIVIVTLKGISNGMGIASYEVQIFRDPAKFPGEKPLTFPVEEFGEKGTFIFDRRKNETQILITFWDDFNTLDKKRGYGTYLVGKWFRYRKGLLEPVLEKPTLARRFLLSFADERNKTYNNGYAPYLWLKSKNTHRFFAAPREISKLIQIEYGVIKNYDEQMFIIQTDSGKSLKGIYKWRGDTAEEENTRDIIEVGLNKSRYIFPDEFKPFTGDRKFIGQRVKLETYEDKTFDEKYTQLWLLEK